MDLVPGFGSPEVLVDLYGRHVQLVNTDTDSMHVAGDAQPDMLLSITTEVTAITRMRWRSTSGNNSFFFGELVDGGDSWVLQNNPWGGNHDPRFRVQGVGTAQGGATLTGSILSPWWLVGRWKSGDYVTLDVYDDDGILIASSASASTVGGSMNHAPGAPSTIWLNKANGGGEDFNSYFSAAWNRRLSDEEVLKVVRNSMQLFRTPNHYDRIVAPSAASGVSGTLSQTLDNVTSSAQGNVDNSGSLSQTLDNITSTASGFLGTDSTLAQTLDAITSSAQGNVDNAGTLSQTLEDITSTASGTVGTDATLAQTLDAIISAAQGNVDNAGTVSVTLDDITSTAAGETGVVATLNQIIDDITSAAHGTVENSGSVNITLDDITSTASGLVGTAGGGSPIMVDADAVYSNGLETALALNVSVSNNGGVSGLSVVVKIRNGTTTNSYLDFNDMTFKTSGHTTIQSALTDLTGGFYTKLLDMTSIVNLPTNNLVLEYIVSGSVTAVAMATIVRIDSLILGAPGALTLGKFLALKDA